LFVASILQEETDDEIQEEADETPKSPESWVSRMTLEPETGIPVHPSASRQGNVVKGVMARRSNVIQRFVATTSLIQALTSPTAAVNSDGLVKLDPIDRKV
jgi:hypothetical protein